MGYYQGYSGCASLQQQRRFAQSCVRRLSHSYSKNAPTYVTEDMEAHPFVCPASRCTYGSTGHVTKAYVTVSNQFKIYIESEVRIFWVYGDFSATLYILKKFSPAVLCGYEIVSLTLREKLRLIVFENLVLRSICGYKWEEVTEEGRKLHTVEPNELNCSPNIFCVIKSRIMRWAVHVAYTGRGKLHAGFLWGNLSVRIDCKTKAYMGF